ncbi:hypothetical protein Sste5346_010185 [Sporothrix stenoceras]|uniref:Zn(2)-C6 fungal-type domain-containing protein n=1 Tax=Sporothrix stenoceras TaxID=5173 RepID=A0ABR3YI88_9PEZI
MGPLQATAGDDPTTRKRKRVKTGCLTCRARKVKCDEIRPVCTKCANLDVDCRWQTEEPTQTQTYPPTATISTQVRRPARSTPACYTCRYARSRCSMAVPTCARCQLYGHTCTYPAPRSGRRTLTPTAQQWMQRRTAEPSTPATVTTSPPRAPTEDGYSPRRPSQTTDQASFSPRDDGNDGLNGAPLYDRLRPNSTQSPTSHSKDAPPRSADSNPSTGDPNYNDNPLPASLTALPSQERLERLAVAFFQYVHVYRSNAFLHRDRALMAIRDGTISRGILMALCAVGARFTTPPEPEEIARAWAADAGHRVMAASECSRETIAVSLLLSIYSQQACHFAQAHNWGAVAMNQAITLGLHREAPPQSGAVPFDEAEGDRRLFFACYVINRFISNGQPVTVTCPTSAIKLRLPCDGFNYRLDVSVETPYAILESDEGHVPAWVYKNVGAMGNWVRLVGARFIMKQCFQAAVGASVDTTGGNSPSSPTVGSPGAAPPWDPTSFFAASIAKLAAVRESLPSRQRLHSGLLHRSRNTTGLGQIVLFYLWWNECHLELCSMALPGYPQSLDPAVLTNAPTGWVEHTRLNCLRYAQAITDIVLLVEEETSKGGSQPLVIHDHTVAHAIYLSIRVQLEVDEEGTEVDRQKLRERLEATLYMVDRTAVFFHSIRLLAKEMRRMLAVHFDGPQEPSPDSVDDNSPVPPRPETPPLPWFRRLKDIEARREKEARIRTVNPPADRLEVVLHELLPDYSSYGVAPWSAHAAAYEGDGFYAQIPGRWDDPSMLPAGTFHTFGETGNVQHSMVDYNLDDDLLPNVLSLPPTVGAVGGVGPVGQVGAVGPVVGVGPVNGQFNFMQHGNNGYPQDMPQTTVMQ